MLKSSKYYSAKILNKVLDFQVLIDSVKIFTFCFYFQGGRHLENISRCIIFPFHLSYRNQDPICSSDSFMPFLKFLSWFYVSGLKIVTTELVRHFFEKICLLGGIHIFTWKWRWSMVFVFISGLNCVWI